MNDSTKNIDLIERYFDNDMSDEEKVTFQEKLKSDLELRHLFDREKLLINTIRFGAAKNHLDFFKELEKSLPEVSVQKTRTYWVYYAAAASLIILLVAGIFLFRGDNPAPNELYAKYFTPYPNVFEPTVRGSSEDSKRALAFQKYEAGNYEEAAKLFAELLTGKPDAGMELLLANANMTLGKTEEAKQNLRKVIESSAQLIDAAQWYLALCYLQAGQTDLSIQTLDVLASRRNPYTARADALLKQLRR